MPNCYGISLTDFMTLEKSDKTFNVALAVLSAPVPQAPLSFLQSSGVPIPGIAVGVQYVIWEALI